MRCIAQNLIMIAGMLWAANAFAQEPAPAEPVPAAAPSAEAAPAAEVAPAADEAQAVPDSNDPGDAVANYFNNMAEIVSKNMDTPAALLDKMTAYIKENSKAMREASKKFDAKMGSLKASEAEVYRETVQRKLTPQLNKLISLLIDFANRYPAEAQKLDSILKVDAKYTYQQ